MESLTLHPAAAIKRRTMSVMVENKFGVLARISTLFAARGFNIDSLAVGETEDPAVSRMTIVASGNENVLEQVEKQLNKLIDVIKVTSFVEDRSSGTRPGAHQGQSRQSHPQRDFPDRRHFPGEDRGRSDRFADREITGDEAKIEALEELLKPFGIKEMVRPASSPWRAARKRRIRRIIMAKVYYDKDADFNLLKGKKIAIIGYGSQGHAHALNLRDSGVNVVIGARQGGKNWDLAEQPRLEARHRERRRQGRRRRQDPRPRYRAGATSGKTKSSRTSNRARCLMLLARLQHPFQDHHSRRRHLDVVMVAPKGPGHLVRRKFEEGGGVPGLIAVSKTPPAKRKSSPCLRQRHRRHPRRRDRNTFKEETETDLFGEQAVLCGGVGRADQEWFRNARSKPATSRRSAYFECLHELKLIVDLIYEGGIDWMNHSISRHRRNTANSPADRASSTPKPKKR